MSNYKGKLITFEGIDGCGKTTAMNYAFRHFNKKYPGLVIKIRDPGTTYVGEKIRPILLYEKLDPWAEFLLFEAVRAQLIKECIIPKLKEGKLIFLDRYIDSTIAYQGFGGKLSLDLVLEHIRLKEKPKPDLTFLFDLPVEVALKRKKSKKLTKFEKRSKREYQKILNGYKIIAKTFKERVYVIDASKSKKEVREEVIKVIDEFLANVF